MGLFSFLTGGTQNGMTAPTVDTQAQGLADQNLQNANSAALANAAAGVGTGQNSLNSVINQYGGTAGGAAGIAQNPFTGNALANQQVSNSQVLGGLYGQGGQLQQAEQQATNLQNTGFQLQPQDYQAYGQASDNIARQFGQNQNSLSAALASRGLGGGGGGVVGSQFAGLQGNQNEQLAQAQFGIAQARYAQNQQMLDQARSYAAQLGGQAQNAINQTQSQNLAGVGQQQNDLTQQQNAAANIANAQTNAQAQAAQANRLGTSGGLFGNLMSGIGSGITGAASGALMGTAGTTNNITGQQTSGTGLMGLIGGSNTTSAIPSQNTQAQTVGASK